MDTAYYFGFVIFCLLCGLCGLFFYHRGHKEDTEFTKLLLPKIKFGVVLNNNDFETASLKLMGTPYLNLPRQPYA